MTEIDNSFGTTTVYCDGTACEAQMEHEGIDYKADPKAAMAQAKAEGWIFKHVNGTFYHYCSQDCLVAK